MAVSAKPKTPPAAAPDPSKFISGAEEEAPKPEKAKAERKERVVLYFDADILEALDKEVAKRRGSRGSVVRELIARNLMEG
jgi:hypothetical protein